MDDRPGQEMSQDMTGMYDWLLEHEIEPDQIARRDLLVDEDCRHCGCLAECQFHVDVYGDPLCEHGLDENGCASDVMFDTGVDPLRTSLVSDGIY